jgi:phosphoketolase
MNLTQSNNSDVAISAYGTARSTVKGAPLSSDELRKIDAYWRASLLPLNEQIACKNHAYEFGIDREDITNWKWPYE